MGRAVRPERTTHILKPGVPGLDGHAENEHFCLALAADLDLPVARSWVVRFDEEVAVVIDRYDRVITPEGVIRIHQEDVCQALGVPPTLKYEADGGPGARAIVDLLREHSRSAEEDIDVLVQALILNWLIGGTDDTREELLGPHRRRRTSAARAAIRCCERLPYAEVPLQKLKLAMEVGGKYRLREVGPHPRAKLAAELKLPPERVADRARQMAGAVPELSADILSRTQREGLVHPILQRLAAAASRRARECAASWPA
jgi:serine/threonine-protein kinase HipA